MIIGIANIIGCKPTSGGANPPVNNIPPSLSGSGVIGTVLTCSDGVWTGTAPITFTYQWKRNGSDIVGEVSSTYTLVNADYSNSITCEVTATNIVGMSSSTSDTIVGTAIAPSNVVLPVISGTNVVGNTLTTTNGTWNGDPSPTYTYKWRRGSSDIVGATSSTYTLVQADASYVVTCVVIATNIAGIDGATSNGLTIIDADAQAFLTAASITDTTITSAINSLVVGFKTNGIWGKMQAIYPFVGGSATTHKFNLKNPADTDAAFRLVFNGGWTHTSNGITGNAVNAFANTFLNASVTISNKGSIGIYSRTNIGEMAYDMTNIVGGTEQSVISRWSTNLFYVNSGSATYPNTANTDSRGLFSMSYNSRVVGYKNTSSVITEMKASSGANNTFKIGGTGFSNYSSKNYAFAYIADELNATEITSLYNYIQTFQTTLGRQV